jgi:phosphate transport system protein
MVLAFFRSSDHTPIEEVEAILVGMLQNAAIVYDTATEAVFGAGKSKEAKKKVRRTDKQIDRGQEEVRQKLMVHGAVRGHDTYLPIVLAYMSVVKDVERVGDYAKNLYDLARYGADLTEGPDAEVLAEHRELVGDFIAEASEIFESSDIDAAQAFCERVDEFTSVCDAAVREAHASQGAASDAVARALFYRFMKRIAAHLLNLVSSMILPIDQLDYYDEPAEDRS